MTKAKLDVTICAPPHREKHVAEIGLQTDEIIRPGTQGSWRPIGEIIIDNGFLEFEISPFEENALRTFGFQEFIDALQEGKERLLEIYPDMKSD